jgi:hypothetical protein
MRRNNPPNVNPDGHLKGRCHDAAPFFAQLLSMENITMEIIPLESVWAAF